MTINTIYYEKYYKEYAFALSYIASLQAIAAFFCFAALFFGCEDVSQSKSGDKKIDQLVLTVGGADTPITFDSDYNAALTVPFGTDLTAITVKTLQISDKATASVAQGDVLTITGGSATLTVTAENGSKQIYTVQVMVASRTGTDITALTVTIADQTYSNTGDDPAVVITNNNIAITLPFGSTLPTSLPLTVLTLSAGASSVPAEGAMLDLTAGAGTITVTAEDGTTMAVYTVQVTIALPRTDTDITELMATIAGQVYSSMGDNPLVTITDNAVAIMIPFGSTLPSSLLLTGLTLSAGASSTPTQGATLDLSTAGDVMISVQAEDPSVAVSYTVSVVIAQPLVTTYTGTDTLGIAVRDVVTEAGRSVSFAAMDTVVTVSGLVAASVDWALGTLTGTKTAMAGTLVLTQSDLAMLPATADATYTLTVSLNGQTSGGKDLFYYPGQLRTWRDLQGMRVNLGGTYQMMQDIDFPDADGDGVSSYNFEPLGRDGVPFSGTFDGGGHEIRNLYINRSAEDYVGLFGQLSGTVRNVGLVGGTVTGSTFVGGLVGRGNSSTITGAYVTGVITGRINIGGLVGRNSGSGTITGAYATGAVTGTHRVGGLVGRSDIGTITGAYATGAVTGDSDVGGLVGINSFGTVRGAYATGAVTGSSDQIGGLVGNNFGGTIVGYARGNVIRTAGNTATAFGRLAGVNTGAATGYYSSQTGESQLLSLAANGSSTALTGATGVDGTARTSASVQADFTGFEFGEEIGKWIYTAGRWPALNLGDLQSAVDQPTQ